MFIDFGSSLFYLILFYFILFYVFHFCEPFISAIHALVEITILARAARINSKSRKNLNLKLYESKSRR